jgi:mRNA-degrading endonuclease RelE of RelBE toxin-antitoxin system
VLEFRETGLFTRAITKLLSDQEYAQLQGTLVVNPEAGDLIKHTGGLRKLRWSHQRRGKGKRGGVRVIYYWHASGPLIYMLLAYSKDEQDDLSSTQAKLLMGLVNEEFK